MAVCYPKIHNMVSSRSSRERFIKNVFGFIFRESSCGPGVRANFAAQNMHSKKLDFVDRREQIVAITHLKRFS